LARRSDVRVVGILLAAGSSTRFGGDKLLQPLPRAPNDLKAGTPIGVAACRHLAAAVSETLAVVRPSDKALAALLSNAGARIVECGRAVEGMGASLSCGVQSTPDADAWLIALADMPWIMPATIKSLTSALAGGADIVAPVHHGERGHPVGFARRHYAALVALSGDEGARAVIAAQRERLLLIDVDDEGILRDVDTPHDIS
jgi:molybdenum cofactor cytidylyltransferase